MKEHSLPETAKSLRRALLIMHSPQDDTVEIKNAEEIYVAAHHPKSFVSLDGADHLLMRKEDSIYAGNVIARWAARYVPLPEQSKVSTRHDVVASLAGDAGFTTEMKVGSHYITADEPERVGGNDFGPNPYEFVSAGLAACTAMTVQMYVRRKGWPLDNIEVHISYSKEHAHDCQHCGEDSAKIDTFRKAIKLEGDLEEKQIKRILEIADRCPVHRTLHSETQVITQLMD